MLGVDLGYAIVTSPNSELTFAMPWPSLVEIILFAYGLGSARNTKLGTESPRIPPAEALRYAEYESLGCLDRDVTP